MEGLTSEQIEGDPSIKQTNVLIGSAKAILNKQKKWNTKAEKELEKIMKKTHQLFCDAYFEKYGVTILQEIQGFTFIKK